MSLTISDNFEYNEKLGVYDFTVENSKIKELRELPVNQTISVNGQPLPVIAYNEYEDVSLWWIIATYNYIIEVDDFDNTTLDLPSLDDVNRLLG